MFTVTKGNWIRSRDTKTTGKRGAGIVWRIVQSSGQANHGFLIKRLIVQLIQSSYDGGTYRRAGTETTRFRHVAPNFVIKARRIKARGSRKR